MTFPSYHLWLKPSGTIYDALSEMIEELAHTLGGPVFAPHVTLLGSLVGTEEQHHRRKTFQDEFRKLLDKHGIEYDERYIWD